MRSPVDELAVRIVAEQGPGQLGERSGTSRRNQARMKPIAATGTAASKTVSIDTVYACRMSPLIAAPQARLGTGGPWGGRVDQYPPPPEPPPDLDADGVGEDIIALGATAPFGLTWSTCQTPSSPLPLVWPGALSPAYVYSGCPL